MDIEIKNIDFDADSTVKLESRKETKRWSKFSNQFIPVVEKISKDKYKLISGAEKIHIATEKGEPKVACNIVTDLNEEEKGALDLRLLYQGSETCPITLGERFLEFRKGFSITQQELAKKTGITLLFPLAENEPRNATCRKGFGRRPFLDRFLATKTKPTIDPTTTPGPSRPDAPTVSLLSPPLGPGCVNELGVTQ